MPEEIAKRTPSSVRKFFDNIGAQVLRFWDYIYPVCYKEGIRTIRVALRFRRAARHLLRPLWALLKKAYEVTILQAFHNIKADTSEMKRDWSEIRAWVWGKGTHNWYQNLIRSLAIPFLATYTYRRNIKKVFMVILPVASVLLAAFTIRYWSNATFALRLTYMGQYVGDIADETVFDDAVAMAEGRVSNVEQSFSADRSPTMELTLTPKTELMDKTELCDVILSSYGDMVSDLYGIYVNGVFEGSIASDIKGKVLLQSILDNYASTYGDSTMTNVSIEFLDNVEFIEGLYPTTTKLSLEEAKELLTNKNASNEWYVVKKGDTLASIAHSYNLSRKQLLQMNPNVGINDLKVGQKLLVKESSAYLAISMTCDKKQNQSIPFEEETVQDKNRYVGDNYIKISGITGIRQITYKVSYVDGQETARKQMKSEIIRQPVTQVKGIGAMTPKGGSSTPGDGVATGNMLWPLPSSLGVGERYGYQTGRFHNGVDIYGNYGAAIVAADGGRVVEAYGYGYNGGWGEYILIDHGNGYQTRYAHCSAVLVTPGEKVSKGQVIARVGSTGWSTCNHLHIEVLYHGSRTDPWPFIT